MIKGQNILYTGPPGCGKSTLNKIKAREDLWVVNVSPQNRDAMVDMYIKLSPMTTNTGAKGLEKKS